MKTLVIAALLALAVAAPAAADPPRIVPWHTIGNVSLGMSKTRVEYAYGRATQRVYGVEGGSMMVSYGSVGVYSISTTSARYRTPGGVGVGTRIPLGVCHHVARASGCEYRWRGFIYITGFGPAWVRNVRDGKRTVQVQLFTERGVVTTVAVVVLGPQQDPF